MADGGVVRGFAVPGGNRYSRKQIDALVEQAKQMGFGGLIWVRPGEPPTSRSRRLAEATLRRRSSARGATSDDLLLVAGGPAEATSKLLGQLRLAIAKKENLLRPEAFEFLWVTDFPLLEWDEETAVFSMHHPFTSPADDDIDKLETEPARCARRPYDLVLNGSEIGGGSIRIHDAGAAGAVFQRLGISDEEARPLRLLPRGAEYGTPPHGGIALGSTASSRFWRANRRSARSSRSRRPRMPWI